MSTPSVTRVAMATAGVMLAHQVASKAFRDAAFLAVWPATTLPLMTIAAAALVVLSVPVFSRLLDRSSPLTVVSTGFLISAAAHAVEWYLSDAGRWIVVVIYLHLAGASALLLSGFWSLVDERFDPKSARANFGRIAAAGTLGGALGSLAAERTAVMVQTNAILLLLAGLHLLCAAGLMLLGRWPTLLPHGSRPAESAAGLKALRGSPFLRTIAALVVLTTAGSGILDYLLKWHATQELGTGPQLLRFFAAFYGGVHVVSFFAQTGTGTAMRRLGIGGTISALPAGVGAASTLALLFPGWIVVIGLRALESVLRGSLFRSGYELLFVPMDTRERRQVKTILDVTCDRAGEAAGAGIVQLLLLAGAAFISGRLLVVVVALAGLSFWLGRRLDQLYLGVVEQQLLKHRDAPSLVLASEAGWTILQLPTTAAPEGAVAPPPVALESPGSRRIDPPMETLSALRSGVRSRVEAALERTAEPDRIQVAQIVDLLAWDDVVQPARRALEPVAAAHLGLLIDALLDPRTDFAIRRRLPRILGTVASARSFDGVVRGLDDSRFEVRYHCSRAIDRMLTKNPDLSVNPANMISVVERELSVPLQVWQGYRLLDRPESEESAGGGEPAELSYRNFEHVFSLLATIVPREPLQAALRGIRSQSAGLRGLALEYLEQVLPPAVLDRLRMMMDVTVKPPPPAEGAATPSSADAPSRSDPPPRAR